MIESVNNKYIKNILKLKQKKYQDKEGLFLVEGKHLVEEAKKSGYLETVISTKEETFDNTVIVSENVLKKLSDLKTPSVIGICRKINNGEINGKVCILCDLQDPGNVGTIIRSAVAFNVDTIVLTPKCVSIYNSKVIRASEGMIFNQNIIIEDAKTIIEKLKKYDYTIYTTDVNGGTSLEDAVFSAKSAVLIGNEGNGVDKEVSLLADQKIHIKMNANCESLNAAVSASIIFYKLNI